MSTDTYAVGARIILRDEEWRITEIDQVDARTARIKCVGLSELVRGKVGIFYDRYEVDEEGESDIQVLRPENTRIVEDHSGAFIQSRLYLEAILRGAPKNDPEKIEIADKAAMDPLPYQFDPALRALKQPRARILIADAVGIGKTLEAGILTSELIARGRGRRILVVATKAMLTQFQREFWTRFTIPLTRLDSAGIQRVRNRIPVNHNPFLYFDRAIISLDTLKQDREYRDYLSKAYWDIIIVDEAHNVAVRNGHSQRAKLAQLLATRSDTMILLSATPHDGRAESFASLLRLLDPTAIADVSHYGVKDFADKGLVVRRFKSSVRDQVRAQFPDRVISTVEVEASSEEKAVFNALQCLHFETLDAPSNAYTRLFSTTLLKAFLSSPEACASVIQNRIAKLTQRLTSNKMAADAQSVKKDIEALEDFKRLVDAVTPEKFSKLNRLAEMLKIGTEASIHWDRKNPKDRLVVFTESVKTLEFLNKYLPKLAGLTRDEVLSISGADKDVEIAEKVNQFNNLEAKVRLFLCSDVASEGINLHHFAHRMVHFDIPWALMTFQQRNGRIDRYGQTEQPQIWYMQTVDKTEAGTGAVDATQERSDTRVLLRLIEKDKQVQENLSDPAEFLLSLEAQEGRTGAAIEGHEESATAVDDIPDFSGDDFFDQLLDASQKEEEGVSESAVLAPVLSHAAYEKAISNRPSLFKSDMDYVKSMLGWLSSVDALCGVKPEFVEKRIVLGVPPDLDARLKYLPAEILPVDGRFDLTDDVKAIEDEMKRCRLTGEAWPRQTLLWPLHPVMLWLQDRAMGLFGRNTAPLVHLTSLAAGERWLLLEGGYPNRRGFMPVHQWIVVHEKADGTCETTNFATLIQRLGLTKPQANLMATSSIQTGSKKEEQDFAPAFRKSVLQAVELARGILKCAHEDFTTKSKTQLEERLKELETLKLRHIKVLDDALELKALDTNTTEQAQLSAQRGLALKRHNQESKRAEIDRLFADARNFLKDTAEIEGEPWIQVHALFVSSGDQGDEPLEIVKPMLSAETAETPL